jgi:hypothetical protein
MCQPLPFIFCKNCKITFWQKCKIAGCYCESTKVGQRPPLAAKRILAERIGEECCKQICAATLLPAAQLILCSIVVWASAGQLRT